MSEEPFYIVGPTGSGKSAVALALAERWNGEIVNADAFQVYKEIPIITAAPTEAERVRVPHHLYGFVSVSEAYNVARYVDDATRVLSEIMERGRRPLIVGGSGLYVKALTHGLSDSPPAEPALRQCLQSMDDDVLVRWLEHLDPSGAAAMNLQNPRYVQRAVEMTLLSGIPASVWKAAWDDQAPTDVKGIVLQWERAQLYERINARVEVMVEDGALQEIAALPSHLSATAQKAIGVSDLQRHLRGELSQEEAIEAIQQASRRYAKRQETWFRRETIFQRQTWDEAMQTVKS